MTTTTEKHGDVVVLRIDHPPVNAGNAVQRRDLHEAIVAALGLAGVRGVVIASAGRHFYAGSDLREFDGELASPTLPDLIRLIEEAPVPFAAAVTGLALGGGLELALACDRRIVDPTAGLGFPEVGFGILPGAGGTVRSSRLVGVSRAIDLVTSARQVGAEEALALGLVDSVVDADQLVRRAVEAVRALASRDLARDRAVPAEEPEAIDSAMAALSRRARPNVIRAAETVRRGAAIDVETALAEERALFDELRRTPESENRRYLFFAKQDAARSLRIEAEPAEVRAVGIVGAGTMGAGLAGLFVAKGYAVTVVDSKPAARSRVAAAVPGVEVAESVDALASADLVIDAVFEDMDVKKSLLRELEVSVRADTVLASNTSYLDLNEMGAALADPGRLAGLHFFNPPERNALVEVIPTAATYATTTATLAAVVRRLGKVGIRAGVADGFVGNRVYADYRAQAEILLEEGASVEQIDAAVVDLGFAIGPFAVADMSGLDIAWARRKRLAATRDPRQRYVRIPDLVCEAGRLGRKTGAGWYDYPDGVRRGVPSSVVADLVDTARREAGVEPHPIGAQEIQDRILGSMLAAAAGLVATGVAQRASDVDVALTEGFAFPSHLGGPLRALARRTEDELKRLLSAVHASDPVGFSILEPASRGEIPDQVRAALAEVAPIAPTYEGVLA